MLVLFELPGGYSLFKVGKAGVKLQSWQPFNDAQEAAESVRKLMESKLPETLKQFLNENIVLKELQDELAVADAKLGNTVKQKLGIPCIYDENVEDLMRQIRTQVSELIEELTEENLRQMSVGLAHTLNRHILKFSADKLDIMVIQAIALLDDLDKEINTYVMRAKEWYGWHFPEMGKVITDNIEYAKIVLRMGMRENATKTDFSGILEDESVVQALRDAAIHSMGVVLTNEDLGSIKKLCEEVLASSEYRAELFTYLKNRMTSIAPNLTVMVGELVGARLISHAGSLVKLAKCPASTIQLLGAEKALFKALKSKHETPKYGLLYHVSLVGQASAKNKGRIARLVGTKTALSSRVDAFAENNSEVSIGAECREKVEYTLRLRESGVAFEKAGQRAAAPTPKYDATAEQSKRPREKTRSEWAAATAAPLPGAGGAEEEEEAPKPKKQRKAAAAAAAAEEEEEAPAAEEPKKRKKKAVAAEEE